MKYLPFLYVVRNNKLVMITESKGKTSSIMSVSYKWWREHVGYLRHCEYRKIKIRVGKRFNPRKEIT